ncbi:hypothetical protein RCCWILLIS_4 [Rhodobacter phage RcCWillis]|nr:hypothetical protein RCCWILLIS_4 [Rhodobacter phage RcCWillis]
MATVTERLLAELNAARGKAYPEIGYSYFADVTGNGIPRRRVYTIINGNGGVTFSDLNGATARERCNRIRAALERETGRAAPI